MIANFLTYVFPGNRTSKLIKSGVNIPNSTSPLTISKNITLTMLDYSAPPPVRLSRHCITITAMLY